MHIQPVFTDARGRPIYKKMTPRSAARKATRRTTLLMLAIFAGVFGTLGAVTQINLTAAGGQVKGILPFANGGTGASSLSAGVARSNGSVLSTAELSGDATTSGSNAVTVVKINGTTITTNSAADQTVVTTDSAVAGWASIPNCTAGALQYTTATHLYNCGSVLTGTFVDAEAPSGTPNGSLQAFGLAHTPSPAGSLALYLNGQRLIVTDDYSLATATITTVGTPQTGDKLIAAYRY